MLIRRLAPDADYANRAAVSILDFFRSNHLGVDLSAARIIVPNLLIAPALSKSIVSAAGQALLLPRIDTLAGTVEPWMASIPHLSDARRMLLLHAQLRRRGWFDDAALWDVVAELTQLFDALTEQALTLPSSEEALTEQLARAFALRQSDALSFESRVAHTLWLAESTGLPSRAAARARATSAWAIIQTGPVVFVAEGELLPPQQRLLNALSDRVPVLLLLPDRNEATGPLAEAMTYAWPANESQTLHVRLAELDRDGAVKALERVRCLAAESLESLAAEVTERVLAWVRGGRRHIALIAADRLAARRTRALLEREGVLVADETGWKMATTRAAASVDALLETLVSDAWHRSLIDLLDAPFMFADVPAELRRAAALQIRKAQIEWEIDKGLDTLVDALRGQGEANQMLLRLQEARRIMNLRSEATVAQWLQRLLRCIDSLGGSAAMKGDAAGLTWFEWAQSREAELMGETERMSFALWRTWFNREMDSQMFRDHAIESPVVMTHLAATRLRRFDAAVIIGADADHLAPARSPSWLAHAGVRKELGLVGEQPRTRLREDLAGLALSSDELLLAWQRSRRDEVILPAAEVEAWVALMQAALNRPIVDSAVLSNSVGDAPTPHPMPRPAVPLPQMPMRLSASALRNLLDCPYRYFSRYVLGLAESDELSETMEKRDYGERLHAALNTFHRELPVVSAVAKEEALRILRTHCEAAFLPDLQRNYLNHAWWLAAEARLEQYIAWQIEREAAGWRWHGGEVNLTRTLTLRDGSALKLHGRIDRIDHHQRAAAVSLLDYKAKKIKALKNLLTDPDDVQLAFYTILHDGDVAEAAYVALDDESIETLGQEDPVAAADLLRQRIDNLFAAMRNGAELPAHGARTACSRCEMRGVCRQDWFAQ